MKKLLIISAALIPQAVSAESQITDFARNVTLHVMLHELGHAIFNELGVPVLTNEETMADSFASIFVTQHIYDYAPQILTDRAKSWIYEDSEVSPSDYDFKGEHDLDIRRAYQTLCVLYGADPAEFADDVAFADISQRDLDDCSDSVPDQIDAWASVVTPFASRTIVEVIYGEGPMKAAMQDSGLMEYIATIAAGFLFRPGLTLHFDHCDQGAFWSNSTRTITLCDDYVARFIAQGEAIAAQ